MWVYLDMVWKLVCLTCLIQIQDVWGVAFILEIFNINYLGTYAYVLLVNTVKVLKQRKIFQVWLQVNRYYLLSSLPRFFRFFADTPSHSNIQI